jgi:AsmA protein
LILAALLVALPLVGFVALRVLLNPEALRPRLVAAVEEATGRSFRLGDVGLALSLRPTLALTDITLANAPGGSRAEMLTAHRVEVQLALLPLLSRRVEIARILLDRPDLLLETDAEGRGNWVLRQAAAPADPAPAPQPAPARTGGTPLQISFDALSVRNARVTWRDGGRAETIAITSLEASAPLAGPVTARGTLALRGQEVAVEATTGPVAALGGAAPWPFDLRLALAGGEARARGTLGPGIAWTAEASARLPDAARLAALLPDLPLPPLRDVQATARLAGEGGRLASADSVSLRVGDSDLSVLRPGLRLARLDVAAPRLDAPVTLAAEAALAGLPIRAEGRTGSPARLLGQARGALPVELRLAAANAEATIRGEIADPQAMAGVNLALALAIPDLAALAPLAGAPLPAVKEIAAGARLRERTPGFRGGAHLGDLTLTSSAAEARGDLTLVVGERPGLSGRLDVARLDLDALAAPAAPAAPAGAAPAPPQPAQPDPSAREGRVIPDVKLPIGALRSFDADLSLTIASLTAAGAAWRDIQLPLHIEAGRARIAPLAITTPGGPVTAELRADAAAATPSLALAVRAPRLDLAALQRAFGQPVYLTGQGEVEADLRGTGAGLREVAGSLAGHLGLAMLDAMVEPALLGPVEQALRARAPVLPPLPQRLPVECVALRADAEGGVARIGTLLVDAPAAKVAGSGTVNLGTEAIALRLLHDIRAAGAEVRVAADLGGTLAAPAYQGVQVQNLGALVGGLAERLGGDAGALLGALANRPGARPAPLPDCGPALAAARSGRQGPTPTPRAQPDPSPPDAPAPQHRNPAPLPGPAGDLLRRFLPR